MITLSNFKYATFEQKCEVVTTQSDYVTWRKLGNCKVFLYQTSNFFVEVYYAPVYEKVLMIHAFNGVDSLLPYVEAVSLADLNLNSSI
jgi:hypothetical protein